MKLAAAIAALLTVWTAPSGPVLVQHARRSGGSAYVAELAAAAEHAARLHGVDAYLLVALSYHESSLNWRAVEPSTGARGLLQLMPRSRWGRAAQRACRGQRAAACIRAQFEQGARALRYGVEACSLSELHGVAFHRFGDCFPVRWRESAVLALRDRIRTAEGS